MSQNPPAFASSADLASKVATLEELAKDVYAYTAEGDPNTGAIIGPDCVLVIDARATPVLAQEFIAEIRTITEKPVRYLVFTHYHAVRVLGASAFGAQWQIGHRRMRDLVIERGQQDFDSELARFPRLFRDVSSIPGLSYPNITFEDTLTLYLGEREVQLKYLGRGHTDGDTAIWLPKEGILFSGDLVEAQSTPYTGDAYHEEWLSSTLDRVKALGAQALVPGRGPAAKGDGVTTAIEQTRHFLTILRDTVREIVRREGTLKEAFDAARTALQPHFGSWPIFEHCLPFDVSRIYDELSGTRPRIWTASRDQEMWKTLQG